MLQNHISSEQLNFLLKHREMYVQAWERWNKIFTFKEISKVIKEQDSQKLVKLLSSSHIIVEQNHINEAIDVGSVENLKRHTVKLSKILSKSTISLYFRQQ